MFTAGAALVGIAKISAEASIAITRTSEIDFLIAKTSIIFLLPQNKRQLYIVIIYFRYLFVNRMIKKFII